MHTVSVIASGFVLLGIVLFGARAMKKPMSKAALQFIPVWFVCAAYNMWVGIDTAGYSFMEELPIFFGVFGVPAVAAFILSRRLNG